MIEVTDTLAIDEAELEFRAVRASGPGGQHVNKTSTAVELRFDLGASPSLPDDVKTRLSKLAGSRMTHEAVLVIFAQTHRSQEMNRQDAIARLVALVRKSAEAPKPRKRTRPTRASKEKRLAEKSRRSGVKSMRGRPSFD